MDDANLTALSLSGDAREACGTSSERRPFETPWNTDHQLCHTHIFDGPSPIRGKTAHEYDNAECAVHSQPVANIAIGICRIRIGPHL